MIHPSSHKAPRRKTAPRIGLLGGSFNPAHEGHIAMSLHALKQLRLREVWWLVSPQNPLKSKAHMASLDKRLRQARRLTKGHPRLRVTAIENKLGTRYTIDILRALHKRHPRTRFVWLMGADNLLTFDRWHNWKDIFHEVPIAVFRRPGYALGRYPGKAAQAFAKARRETSLAGQLVMQEPPAWLVLDNKPHAQSATKIRRRRAVKQTKRKGT